MNPVLEEFLSNHPGRDLVIRTAEKSSQSEQTARTHNDQSDSRGLRLHYIDEGEGEPVVMLHGNPSWSFLYRNLIDSLRGSHRVIVPDHIGCGLSEKPDDSRYTYTLQSRVDDLEALLDHLGLDRELTLVLHDWGGMIGMAYAAQAPGTDRAAGRNEYGGVSKPASKPLPWALAICRSSFLAAPLVRGANAFLPWHGADRLQATAHAARAAAAYVYPYDSWAIASPSSASSRIFPCAG